MTLKPSAAHSIRLASLSCFVATTPGWQTLCSVIAQTSLYNILAENGNRPVNPNFPGLGYLLFLEDTLGMNTVREYCPLVLPLETAVIPKLLQRLKCSRKENLPHTNKQALCAYLARAYYAEQRSHAQEVWPSNIASPVKDLLNLALPKLLLPSATPYYQAYLAARFGWPNQVPIAEDKHHDLKQAMLARANEAAELEQYCFPPRNCQTQLASALQYPILNDALHALTESFSRDSQETWQRVIKEAQQKLRFITSDQESLGPDTPLSELLDVRTSNALESRGITTFAHLSGISNNYLLRIDQIGETAIREIRKAEHKVRSALRVAVIT